METVYRQKMCAVLYPFAAKALQAGSLTQAEVAAAIATTAEGYSFPTNLGLNPPKGGLAHRNPAASFCADFVRGMSEQAFVQQLEDLARKSFAWPTKQL